VLVQPRVVAMSGLGAPPVVTSSSSALVAVGGPDDPPAAVHPCMALEFLWLPHG